jgi:alanine-alpha-ketoisovalerate/valine-pyruvate aminotransferase
MRGGLDQESILRKCVVVKNSNADKIYKLAKDNNIPLIRTSDYTNPCTVIVPELIKANVINANNANTFFSSL